MIKPIFCISISFQLGHQLQKGFRNIVPSEPFIGKNVKIQVFYSGRSKGTDTSVCLRAEVYGCEIPQGKTFCLLISIERKCVTSSYHGSKMSEFCLSWQRKPFASSIDWRKVWAIVWFLSAFMHRKAIHVNFFLTIFEGPQFVEIQKFCFHGIVKCGANPL